MAVESNEMAAARNAVKMQSELEDAIWRGYRRGLREMAEKVTKSLVKTCVPQGNIEEHLYAVPDAGEV